MLEHIRTYERRRRFWSLVDVGGPEECWQWRGTVDQDGQAWFGRWPADQHAYQLARGPLPGGAHVSHSCGDSSCMNPQHMEKDAAGA